MTNSFGLSEKQERVLTDIMKADGSNFSVLVSVAGLDPSVDFVGADLRGVDFGRSNLEGYNFSDADLSGCRFDRARLKGAIFARNRDYDTVWPEPPSERRPYRAVLRATADFVLRPFQSEAVSYIVSALEFGVLRPVVLMPLGTGRTMVLEALLLELDKRDMLGVALVYAPSLAASEQLRQRFSQRFGSDAVIGLNSKQMLASSYARLIVAGINSLRTDKSKSPPTRTYDGITHIIVFDGALSSARLRYLQSLYPGVQIVGFADTEPTARKHRTPLVTEGEIVFKLSYNEAVRAQLLEPAEIHACQWPGGMVHDEEHEIGLVVPELLEVVRSMPNGAVGGIVCQNVAIAQKLARDLHDGIDNHRESDSGIQRVVQHTSLSADESLVLAALDLPGTVLVMNDLVASNFDWAVLDYAIVMTRLRSPEHLAFVRRKPGRERGLKIVDYKQNFGWVDYQRR